MNNLKIGVASVTFRNKTSEEVVEIAKKAGVSYIEWGADVHVKTFADAEKVKKLCDENNIKISSYGSYYRVGSHKKEEWENICKNAHVMGADSVRVWLGKKDSEETSEEEYGNLLSDLEFMCDKAGEYNLSKTGNTVYCPQK